MVIRGIYTAARSMCTENRRIDVLANNIANADTNGYKKDTVITGPFSEVLISRINDNSLNAKLPSFEGITVEYGQDKVKIQAQGAYLAIDTPRGRSYSGCASICVSPEGYLVTGSGNYLMGCKGRIQVKDLKHLHIDGKGTVFSEGQPVDTLSIAAAPDIIGTMNAGARTDDIVTLFAQGGMKQTNRNTDLAIKGDGFFTVLADGREMYTRDGSFQIDSRGYLVTSEGYRVLGRHGEINTGGGKISVTANGDIYTDGDMVDSLKLVTPDDYRNMMKVGDNLYKATDSARINTEPHGEVLQGFIEASGVNTVKEMVDMISAFRSYEANQRVVLAYDGMIEKAANEIGRI